MRNQIVLPCLLLGTLCSAEAVAQDVVDGFSARQFKGSSGVSMPYRLFIPAERTRTQPLPLVIYLHGGAGAGLDNLKQISGGNTNGTHVWIQPALQARHPAFVLAPQLAEDQQWSMPESDRLAPYAALVVELLEQLSKDFKIDRDRVYLTGQSRGGRGTWDIISKRPELFAAAVPLCGDGTVGRIKAAHRLPIWAFHGAKDDTVPVSGSRELVEALRRAGNPVKYTEYPDAGHNIWTLAYVDPELQEWLFAQRRAQR